MGNSSSTTAAGVLSIVSGVFGILGSAGLILFAVFFISLVSFEGYPFEDSPFVFLEAFYLGWGIVALLLAILAVIGGIYALQRKHWGLALAGSIAAILVFFPTGIAAIIFIALSKNEFNHKSSSP
jgi:hypothetical protein